MWRYIIAGLAIGMGFASIEEGARLLFKSIQEGVALQRVMDAGEASLRGE